MVTASSLAPDSTSRLPQVELILSQLDQLPTLPAVAARLLQVTTSDTTGASDVAAVIKTDQALTAKVLALVRRADLGVRDVRTVERAIVLLGFKAVRNAVLAVQVYDVFQGAEAQTGAALDRTEFWKHTLAVACAARLLAQRAHLGKLQDEAFVCGLLHDLGKIALDACLPKSYARVLRQARNTGRCLCDVEHEILGVDHTVAGKRLATRWKLPQSIIDSIWLHHQPPSCLPDSIAFKDVLKVVHVADQLVRHQRIGCSGYSGTEPFETLAPVLRLESGDLQRVIESLPEQMEQHCQLIGIQDLTAGELYAKAVAEANAELGRLNAALADANRRLEVRARCFDALSAFTGSLALDDTKATVCLAAARCVREVLQIDAAIGFYRDAGGALYHVGVCSPDGEHVETLAGPVEGVATADFASLNAPFVEAAVSPAVATAQPVIEHFPRVLGAGPVQVWPITHAGQVIGGVLFAADAELAQPLSSSSEEFAALSVAFGLAVAGAADRASSDRLNEELAHANRQLHQARAELLRAKSLAMIGEMAAGTAHELNNPLTVISGRAQMLAKSVAEPQQRREAETIREHAQRASNIVTDLVRFAKPDPPRPQAIHLADSLRELCGRWRIQAALGLEQLRVSLSDAHLHIFADPDQLREVFDALLTNAVEATSPENARLVINSNSLSSDDRVVVTVEDNGGGMTAEVLEHAADPFFSHRTAGRGRGMGLSMATRLATNNGGRLWLESTPGVGTRACLELPAARP